MTLKILETFKTGSDKIPALDSCGGSTDRIFGGVDAAKNSWPWIVRESFHQNVYIE